MNSGEIRRALVSHCDWWASKVVIPEFELDGDRLDLLQVTKSGFAVGYEIKVSADDWRKDLAKTRWSTRGAPYGSPYLSRFFFVVPGERRSHPEAASLEFRASIKRPQNLPPGTGIMVVIDGLYCREVVASKRFKAEPLPEAVLRRARDAFYYRYWRLEREHRDLRAKHESAVKDRDRARAAVVSEACLAVKRCERITGMAAAHAVDAIEKIR